MSRSRCAIVLTLVFFLQLFALGQTAREPSTPAERDRLLKLAVRLETEPLNPSLAEERKWAMQWIADIPDITVNLCEAVYRPLMKAPHGNLLAEVQTIAETAYIIQHPERAQLDVDVNLAGTQAMLKAYQTIVARAPRQRSDELDDLLEKQKAGTLANYISDATMKCSTNPKS